MLRHELPAHHGGVHIGAAHPAADRHLVEAQSRERAQALRAQGLSARDIVRTLTESDGAPRNVAYRLAHEEGEGSS